MIKSRNGKDSNGDAKILLITNSFYMLSMLIFGITKNFSIMLTAYLLLNMLKSINKPIMNALISSNIKGNVRATVLSTNGQINSLGEILGGPIIGVIANKFSVGIGISATVIFLIPVISIFSKMSLDAT
jgi:DHA3 family tetracycline resistance protein-like MFS transporter